MKIQKKRKEKKRRTPTLKEKKPNLFLNLLAFRVSAGLFIRHKDLLEDETRPRVENRRVAHQYCHENAEITVILWQNQGLRSLVLASNFASLR